MMTLLLETLRVSSNPILKASSKNDAKMTVRAQRIMKRLERDYGSNIGYRDFQEVVQRFELVFRPCFEIWRRMEGTQLL